MYRSQSVLEVLQEVDQYVEAVVQDEAPLEVRRKEAAEALVIEDEGVPGEEDEEVALVLGEEPEEVILILQGLDLEEEVHRFIRPGVAAKGVLYTGKYPK